MRFRTPLRFFILTLTLLGIGHGVFVGIEVCEFLLGILLAFKHRDIQQLIRKVEVNFCAGIVLRGDIDGDGTFRATGIPFSVRIPASHLHICDSGGINHILAAGLGIGAVVLVTTANLCDDPYGLVNQR